MSAANIYTLNCFIFNYGLKLNSFRPSFTGVASQSGIPDISFFNSNLIHHPVSTFTCRILGLSLEKIYRNFRPWWVWKKNSVSLFHKDNTHFKWQKTQRKLTYIKFTWVISEAMNFCPLSEAWLAVKIEVIRIKVMFSECLAQKWIVYGEYN